MKFQLRRVIVFVSDVEGCAAFYEAAFGLQRVEASYIKGEFLEVDGGGCKLAFHKARGVKGKTGSTSDPHKIVFYAKDVARAREELVARGAAMREVKEFGELRLCDGVDPEGHVFQISNRS